MEAVHLDYGCNGDLFFAQFLASGAAEQFERGNPKFVGGMSGVELALEVFRRTTGQIPDVDASAYGESRRSTGRGGASPTISGRVGCRFARSSPTD